MASGPIFVNNLLKKKGYVMFSKSTSPESQFCRKTLQRLDGLNSENLTVADIDRREDVTQIENQLLTLVGRRDIPAIFLDGRYVGGYSWLLQHKLSGTLQQLVQRLPGVKQLEERPQPKYSVRAKIWPSDERKLVFKVAPLVTPAPTLPDKHSSFGTNSRMYREKLAPIKRRNTGRMDSLLVGDPKELVGTIAELPHYARPLIEEYAYRRKGPRGSFNSYSTDAKTKSLQDPMVYEDLSNDDCQDDDYKDRRSNTSSRPGGRPEIKVVKGKGGKWKLKM